MGDLYIATRTAASRNPLGIENEISRLLVQSASLDVMLGPIHSAPITQSVLRRYNLRLQSEDLLYECLLDYSYTY